MNNNLKRTVEITISSKSENQEVVQRVDGQLYKKRDSYYVTYREPAPEMGNTLTVLKIASEGLTIRRHGSIQSEQHFALHRNMGGHYSTPQGSMELHTYTREIDDQLHEGVGYIAWNYELIILGEHSGDYFLRVDIRRRE